MNNQSKKLPSGIVNFTISQSELKDILSEKYDVDVESVSFEETGVSISLSVQGNDEEEEEFEEEYDEGPEEEYEEGQPDVSDY